MAPSGRHQMHALLAHSLILGLAIALASAVCPRPEDIRPCTCDDEGLQCLSLNNSGLARVFRAPAELRAIRRVWIVQANLTELPPRAFGDYIIRDLYLDLNKIGRVHANAFGEASKTLQSLSLTRNSISEFPFDDLRRMGKIKQLGFGYNQLATIQAGAFPPSETLESLDLSHNLISNIGPNAFSELYEVSLIDLSRNQLVALEADALRVKSAYRHLAISLKSNKINKIAMNAFGGHHPYSLDLSRNQLTYLDRSTFEPLLVNDTVIYVEDNPFTCSGCELYKWLVQLDKRYSENLINFSCSDETKLEDLTLEMIGCPASDDEVEEDR